MRRWASALLVAGIVGALVGVGAPAYGVEPVAPPVPESPYKTSQLFGYSQAEWDGFDDGTKRAIANRNYALLDEAKRILAADPTAGVDDAPKPAGTPSKLLRGAGVLGLVMAVPMIVNGTLQIVGVSAEVNASPDEMICAGVGTTAGNVFLSTLYGEVDCSAKVTVPNADMPPGPWTLPSGAAFTVMYPQYYGSGGYFTPTALCGSASTPLPPAGHYYQATFSVSGYAANAYPSDSKQYYVPYCGTSTDKRVFLGNNIRELEGATVVSVTLKTTQGVVVATATRPVADPTRLLDCEVKWSDGSTTTVQGLTYKESEGFPLGAAGCTEAYSQRPSPSVLPEEWSISSTREGDSGSRTEVATGDVPAEAGAAAPSETSPDANRGLRLLKVVGTQSLSCMTWEVDCADWWDESESGSSSTTPYRCWYGAAVVDLKECGIYRNSFKSTASRVITEPSSGEDVQWGTGTSSTPNSTSPGSFPNPGDACFSSWPSIADPVSWVLHPVKCALVAAFVPRLSKVSEARDSIDAKWKATAAGSVTAGLTALSVAFDQGVGCGGLPLHLDFPGFSMDTTLLASCEEPAAGIAATVRLCLVIIVWVGSFLAALRYLAALFGFAAFGAGHEGVLGGQAGGPRFR